MVESIAEMDAMSRLGTLVAQLFGKSPDVPTVGLEAELNSTLARERGSAQFTQEDIVAFCDTIQDFQKIHRDKAYAVEKLGGLGATNVLIPGTMLAASNEAYVQDVISILNERLEAKVIHTGQHTKLPTFATPDERLRWQVTGYAGKNGVVSLKTGGVFDYIVKIPIENTLGTEFLEFVEPKGERIGTTQQFVISDDLNARYYAAIHEEPAETVAWSLLSGFETAALLKLVGGDAGDIDGLNRGMNAQFYAPPSFGSANIDLYLIRKPTHHRRGEFLGRWGYKFSGVASQDGRPISSATIDILSNKEIKLDL